MGLTSSRCTARQQLDCPSTQAFESSSTGSGNWEGSCPLEEQQPSNCSSDTPEAWYGSRGQMEQDALFAGDLEGMAIQEAPRPLGRIRPLSMNPSTGFQLRQSQPDSGGMRILSQTMQVNTEPLTRVYLRQCDRLDEAGEAQVHLGRCTDFPSSLVSVEPERSSALGVERVVAANDWMEVHSLSQTSANMTYRPSAVESSFNRERVEQPPFEEEAGRSSTGSLAHTNNSTQRGASGHHFSYLLDDTMYRAEVTGRQNRRSGGRRLWDALTCAAVHRRFSHEHISIPCRNGRSSVSDRRADILSLPYEERRGHSLHTNRSLNWEDTRRRFRSQVSALQRLSSNFVGVSGHPRPRVRGVRREVEWSDVMTQTDEETSTRASISRIIMLAEALFQILDEIQRQSAALSESVGLTLALLPAPEAVVESMPVRIFQKAFNLGNKEESALQCHICLVEYEAGDTLRVLPCKHEYHVSCIDKWLREAQRVCPLCRGDVCEPQGQGELSG